MGELLDATDPDGTEAQAKEAADAEVAATLERENTESLMAGLASSLSATQDDPIGDADIDF